MDDRTTFDALPREADDLEPDAPAPDDDGASTDDTEPAAIEVAPGGPNAAGPSVAGSALMAAGRPSPAGTRPRPGAQPRPGAEPRPVPSGGPPRSRADRSRPGERSAPVDWATLVDDLAASDRPTFTAATTEDREMELRLCHLHLRTGSFATARVQLETLAGAGHLDRDGLLDLAEARWRTGDLAGAAQAVDTYLEAGGNAPMGHVIAAEARSALGRPGEARRHARLAIEGLEVPLDAMFAGQSRSAVWPQDPTMAPLTDTLFGSANAATAEQGGRIGVAAGGTRGTPSRGRAERADAAAWVAQGPGGAVGGGYATSRGTGPGGAARSGSGVGAPNARGAGGSGGSGASVRVGLANSSTAFRGDAAGWTNAAASAGPSADRSGGTVALPGRQERPGSGAGAGDNSELPPPPEATAGTGLWDDDVAPVISSDAHVELERARSALSDGELHAAALRLAVVLRLSPALAPVVLDVVGPWPGPEFAMVRGDALRLVGREAAAQQAYAAASAGIVDASPRPKPMAGPPSARSDSRLVIDSRDEPRAAAETDPGQPDVAPSSSSPSPALSSASSTSPSPLPIDPGDPPPS